MKLMSLCDWHGPSTSDRSGSVQKIFDGTLRAIANTGTRRLSMSDIIANSSVSRGTLYRYFASKDEVLAALSEYICASFEEGIFNAGKDLRDPIERFRAVLQYFGRFTIQRTPDGMFEAEPGFHLNFLRTHFDRHKAAVQKALGPVLDYFDTLSDRPFDRDLFCDTLVRLQLSTLLIPAAADWIAIWNNAPEQLYAWALKKGDLRAAALGKN